MLQYNQNFGFVKTIASRGNGPLQSINIAVIFEIFLYNELLTITHKKTIELRGIVIANCEVIARYRMCGRIE